MSLSNRLKKIDALLKSSEEEFVVFHVRYGHEEEDFQEQHKRYLMNGGSPDSLFILIVKFSWDE